MTSYIKTITKDPESWPKEVGEKILQWSVYGPPGVYDVLSDHKWDSEPGDGWIYLYNLRKIFTGETLMVARDDLETLVSYAKYASDKGLLIKDGLIKKSEGLLQDKDNG